MFCLSVRSYVREIERERPNQGFIIKLKRVSAGEK